MKFAIYGAGAVGSVLAARLLDSGEDVALIARGDHLAAIRERGLVVCSETFGRMESRPVATDDPAAIGPVDVVLICVKAHSLPAAAATMPALFHERTTVVTFQNGFPWWYFHGLGDAYRGMRVEAVDPGGVIEKHIDPRRVIGGIAYCSASRREPGVIEHLDSARFPLGEPDGSRSERILALAETFRRAGLKAALRTNIRHEIWVKLLGNVPYNPISALTRSTLGEFLTFPPTRELVRLIMEEVRAVAAAFDMQIGIPTERRIDGAAKVGAHKTSMLQDFEAGRRPELEPIVGAVVELAGKRDVPVPNMRAVYALTKLLMDRPAEFAGKQPGGSA